MSLSLEKKVTTGFTLAIAALVANAFLAYHTTRSLSDLARQNERSHLVLHAAQELRIRLQDVERLAQGLLSINEPRPVDEYRRGVDSLAQTIHTLRELTTHDRLQTQRLDSLEAYVSEWVAEFETIIASPWIFTTRDSAGPALTENAAGRMADIRRTIGEVRSEERSAFEARQMTGKNAGRLPLALIALLSIFVCGNSIVMLFSVHRELHHRNVSHIELRTKADRLLAILGTRADPSDPNFTPTRMLNLIAKRTQALVFADAVVIHSEDGQHVTSTKDGIPQPSISTLSTILSPIAERCIRTGKFFRCDNTGDDSRVDAAAFQRANIQSMMFTPVKGGAAVLGVIVAVWQAPHACTDEHIEMMQHLARTLGDYLALMKATDLRTKAEQSLEEMRKRMDHIATERDQMVDALQQTREELKARTIERDTAEDQFYQLQAEFKIKVAEQLQPLEGDREFLRELLENLVEAVVACDADGNITLFNRTAREWHGFETDTPSSREWMSQFYLPGPGTMTQVPPLATPLARALRGDRVRGLELIVGRPGWSPRYIVANGDPLFDEAGKTKGAAVIMHDITERKRFEERMQEQASLLDISHDAIVVRNREHRILFWNNGATRLYGWTAFEAIGKKAYDLLGIPLSAYEEAMRVVLAKDEWSGELRQMRKDGSEIIVQSRWTLDRDANDEPKSILVIDTDITEKKKLEEQFLRAQRMESIGTLAGGIAHDLNNVLTPILLSVNVLRKKLSDDHSLKIIELLDSSARRGAGMVKQVLTFARGVEGERGILQPKHLVRELESITSETFPKSIAVSAQVPKDLWTVNGDSTQIHQVLLNLCVNARDAMPQGGRLTLRGENVVLDDNAGNLHPNARPGPYVKLSVSDTGAGIPPEVMDRIFDPFFTTKELGKGTGLGLSTVLGIVQSHGGFLLVESEVNAGSTFSVYLPAAESAEGQHGTNMEDIPRANGECVLVIDDELTVREITKTTLETFGYRVLSASEGTEAVSVFGENAESIRIVVCDMMMPEMDGPATIRALKHLRPDIPVVAVTGLIDEQMTGLAQRYAGIVVLLKPYSTEKLLMTLHEVLSAS